MTQNPQLFSGPELAALLGQVRDQLGEDATILEANRLRKGGVAGFFARQRFEVVAVARDAGAEADVVPRVASGFDVPTPSASAAAPPATPGPPGATRPAGLRAGGHIDSLLDRADRISSDERHAPLATVPAGSRPPLALTLADQGTADARFQEILRTALKDVGPDLDLDALASDAPAPQVAVVPTTTLPATELPPVTPFLAPPSAVVAQPVPPAAVAAPVPPAAVAAPVPPATPPSVAQPAPGPPASPPGNAGAAPARTPDVDVLAAGVRRRVRRVPPSHQRSTQDLHALPAGGFWSRLLRFEQLLDQTPLDAAITVLVGPVDDAVAVARVVADQGGIDAVDLVVVTPRPAVDGVAPWQVVDRDSDVAQRVAYWRSTGRSALVVVDLDGGDSPAWARHMVDSAAADLTRLVVRTLDDGHHLAATLRGLGPVAALDLSRPPAPELLVPLVEHGVRVATVCGRPLTPLLLAGLTGTHDHG